MRHFMTGISSDDTILCTAGVDADRAFGAVMPPLYLSANFAFESYGKPRRARLFAFRQPDP